MAKWCSFFSQTGSEIVEISKRLNRWPDVIITNQRPVELRKINSELADKDIIVLSNKPTVEEYLQSLNCIGEKEPHIITLHGWLRIVPEEIINKYQNMYNGHPGLITKYPELKGKDPQEKAFNLQLASSGCVIHRVTAGVDEGPVLRLKEIPIQGLTLEKVFEELHTTSIDLWCRFLKRHWV